MEPRSSSLPEKFSSRMNASQNHCMKIKKVAFVITQSGNRTGLFRQQCLRVIFRVAFSTPEQLTSCSNARISSTQSAGTIDLRTQDLILGTLPNAAFYAPNTKATCSRLLIT